MLSRFSNGGGAKRMVVVAATGTEKKDGSARGKARHGVSSSVLILRIVHKDDPSTDAGGRVVFLNGIILCNRLGLQAMFACTMSFWGRVCRKAVTSPADVVPNAGENAWRFAGAVEAARRKVPI